MAEHTPGPWEVFQSDGAILIDTADPDSNPDDIVALISPGRTADPQKHADARLIAAAPDLLKAIEDFLAWGAMTGSDRDLFEQKFRELVAKARGEQP